MQYAPSEATRMESASAAIAVVVDIARKTEVHCGRFAKTRCHLSENFGHQTCRGKGCKLTRAIDARRKINIPNSVWVPCCLLSCRACRRHTLARLWQLSNAIFPQQPMAKDFMDSNPSPFANSTLTPLTKSRKTIKQVSLSFVGSHHFASHTKPIANCE